MLNIREIEKNRALIKKGTKVLLAVSGGPDSVFLFHYINELRGPLKIKLGIAHLNHCLRGDESDSDEKFVQFMALQHGVPFYTQRVDIGKLARARKGGVEQIARRERYAFLRTVCQRHHYDILVLGHTADDQAETVLMNFVRGGGTRGLAGMSLLSCRDQMQIYRPLLNIPKKDILAYLDNKDIEYRIDSSNNAMNYFRNKIRSDLLPYLQERYNTKIKDTLRKCSAQMASVDDYLKQTAAAQCAALAKIKNHSVVLAGEDIQKLHCAVRIEVYKCVIEKLKGDVRSIEYDHLRSIDLLLQQSDQKSIVNLPGSLAVRLWRGYLYFKKIKIFRAEPEETEIPVPGKTVYGDLTVEAAVLPKSKVKQLSSPHYECFDYEKCRGRLFIRPYHTGERMRILGMRGRKLISQILKDEAVEKAERKYRPVLGLGKEIMSLCGIRTSEDYKVSPETKKVLKISYQKKESVIEK